MDNVILKYQPSTLGLLKARRAMQRALQTGDPMVLAAYSLTGFVIFFLFASVGPLIGARPGGPVPPHLCRYRRLWVDRRTGHCAMGQRTHGAAHGRAAPASTGRARGGCRRPADQGRAFIWTMGLAACPRCAGDTRRCGSAAGLWWRVDTVFGLRYACRAKGFCQLRQCAS